jgi:hypothetical protein
MRATSETSTRALFARCRFRLALFDDIKWRREAWARRTLPVPVTLNRLATAFFVFLRATDFGIRVVNLWPEQKAGKPFLLHPIQDVEIGTDQHRDDHREGKQTHRRPCGGQKDQPLDEVVFRIARLHGCWFTPLAETAEAKTRAERTLYSAS